MSYLLDKKIKQKKFLKFLLGIIFFLVLFYFRAGIWSGLSYASHKVFRPVLVFGNNLGVKFQSLGLFFVSKNSLLKENENLKLDLDEARVAMANYASVLAENSSLKEIFDRKNEKDPMILSAILSKPNQSLYDTLIIDVGTKNGVKEGSRVFALGNIPIGHVSDVYPNSSKVILFSSAGENTQVAIGNIFMEVVGRGGGNFEMILPRDFILMKGDQMVLPGIYPYVLGIVETVISDPRDPFQKALLTSPVNIQELKFVQIDQQK